MYRDNNGHISEASNSALALATGDWVALLDHDDCLHKMALYFVAEAIAVNPNASLIYSDEDKVDQSNDRYNPYFKCDYNYELLLAHNMVCHLAVFRRSLIDEIGGFRKGFEGAQDYDLVLRATERLTADQVATYTACPVSLARAPRKHCIHGLMPSRIRPKLHVGP